jgi:hypothetical protein
VHEERGKGKRKEKRIRRKEERGERDSFAVPELSPRELE